MSLYNLMLIAAAAAAISSLAFKNISKYSSGTFNFLILSLKQNYRKMQYTNTI